MSTPEQYNPVKIFNSRLDNLNTRLDQVEKSGDEVGKIEVLTDVAWIEALQHAGLDVEEILLIWSFKDNVLRQMARDSSAETQEL